MRLALRQTHLYRFVNLAEMERFELSRRFEPTYRISSNFETVPLRRHIEAVHGSYYALNPLKNQDFLSI